MSRGAQTRHHFLILPDPQMRGRDFLRGVGQHFAARRQILFRGPQFGRFRRQFLRAAVGLGKQDRGFARTGEGIEDFGLRLP